MTNREYHADGLEFALKTFVAMITIGSDKPTDVMIANAIGNVRDAALFLREEQRAFDTLFERNE